MLLLNTLPAFAERTDVIPTGGVWEKYIQGQGRTTFNDLQSACNAAFDYNYTKPDAELDAALKKLNPPETVFDGSCYPFYLLEEELSYYGNGVNGYGYCSVKFKNRVRFPGSFDGRYPPQYACSDFIYGVEMEVVHKPPTCPAPVNGQRAAAADCTQTVSLTPVSGQAEPRPKGSEGNGKSTYDLIAKVTEGNQPKAGMALTFTVEVEAGSGNHPLNPPDRPLGELSVKSGTTNASGEVKVTFTSPIFSGKHTVTAVCAKCTGIKKDDTATFNVKVPNLIKTPAYKDWRFISNDNYHKNNNASTATQTVYYLTQAAQTNLTQLTTYMIKEGWRSTDQKLSSVGLNDSSLEWGGKFYSYKSGTNYIDWTSNGRAHKEHRIGAQIDLRISDLPNELKALRKQMYDKVCNPQDGKYPVQTRILWHTGVQKCKNEKGVLVSCTGEHYHAYLLGDIDKKLGGGQCSSTPN